jgi:hypothetical protein
MPDEPAPPTSLVALRDARERAIAILTDAFTRDLLDVDEFDRRLALAHRADQVALLEPLVADLAASTTTALATPAQVAASTPARSHQRILAILGGTQRMGHWSAPRELRIFAFMGGVQLDFREARLGPGVTDVYITAIMGGAQIIVPPQLAVEMDGSAIMGGFDHSERAPASPDPDRPLLRVHGFACMGGVSIETRLPGESERDSHRRRRHERHESRRARRLAARSERPDSDQ